MDMTRGLEPVRSSWRPVAALHVRAGGPKARARPQLLGQPARPVGSPKELVKVRWRHPHRCARGPVETPASREAVKRSEGADCAEFCTHERQRWSSTAATTTGQRAGTVGRVRGAGAGHVGRSLGVRMRARERDLQNECGDSAGILQDFPARTGSQCARRRGSGQSEYREVEGGHKPGTWAPRTSRGGEVTCLTGPRRYFKDPNNTRSTVSH